MRTLRAVRALARVEVRQFLRHRARTALLLLLVAVPVAAVAGGSTLARIVEATPVERAVARMGRAAMRIEGIDDYETYIVMRDLLPSSARLRRMFLGRETVAVPGRRLHAVLYALDPAALEPDGLAAGMLQVQTGRAPANAGEVALSPVLLRGLDRGVGDTVTLEYGPLRTICGVVIDPETLDAPVVLRAPAAVEHRGLHAALVDLPADETEAAATTLREHDFSVRTRAEAARGSSIADDFVVALGTIGFLEAGLVIASAFAVGLRRRQREIGLLGATGASARGIVMGQLVSAAVLAVAGGIIGAAAGVGFAAVMHPHLDDWNRRLNGVFEVPGGHVVGAMLLGVAAAVLAAVLPARRAAHLPVRVALGGRRPPARSGRSGLALGMVMVAAGVGLVLGTPRDVPALAVFGVLLGPILGVLGFGVCSPWLLGALGRCAAPLPLAWRLSVRDAGRFRARNGPVVTAVLAGMSMSVTGAVLLSSVESAIDLLPSPYRDDQLLVDGPAAADAARQLAAELPCLAAVPLTAVYTTGQPIRARFDDDDRMVPRRAWVACGDETLLTALGVEDGAEDFRAGRLLALDPPPGEPALRVTTWLDERPIAAPPIAAVTLRQHVAEPMFVLDESRLAALGLEQGPPLRSSIIPWLLRTETPVTPATLEHAQRVATAYAGTTVDAALLHAHPARGAYLVLLLLCGGTGLVIVAIATALSAAESADDRRILHAVGAAPALLRRHQAAGAAYLAVLGCGLAVPAGLLPAIAMFNIADIPLPFVVPWTSLALTVLALPVVVYGGTWLFASLDRRRPAGAVAGAVLLLATTGSPAAAQAESRTENRPDTPVHWTPHAGDAFDGSPLTGELGRVRVPENRPTADDATIEIAFVRYRTSNPRPGPPIIYLAGGPGGSGVEFAGRVATHPQLRLLDHCDVIGIDQRGTGFSRPNLVDREFFAELPLDRPCDRRELVAGLVDEAVRCAAYWRDAGVDLGAYTTAESADDIDDVRRALGVPQVILYGSSYGSHLGLAYLRRHSDRVARALLIKVEGPNHTWKLPSTVQQHLESLHAGVAAGAGSGAVAPDVLALTRDLLAELEQRPVTVELTRDDGGRDAVTVGPEDLRRLVARALGSTVDLATLPALLERGRHGDWADLAEAARDDRRPGINAMTLMMDCASGATAERWARIARERDDPENLLGDAIFAPYYPELCAACDAPDLGDGFRGVMSCDVPTLFVSGTLDVRTPPENVESMRPEFSRGIHVIVENTGHDARELMSPEYRQIIQAFLRGEPVEPCTIILPMIRFD